MNRLPPVIENIKAEKLEGPKILGKIELPVDSDTRPKPCSKKRENANVSRLRKRIRAAGSGGFQAGTTGRHGRNRRPQVAVTAGSPFKKDDRSGRRRRTTAGGGNRRPEPRCPREAKEIDQKEIQEKIRQTQAKLAGAGGRGKSLKAKYRRAKRDEMAEQTGMRRRYDNKLQVTEFISVSELANLMDVSYADVISKCMSLGMMVSINQRLEAEVIELVAGEFGYAVEFIGMDDAAEMEEEEDEDDRKTCSHAPRS